MKSEAYQIKMNLSGRWSHYTSIKDISYNKLPLHMVFHKDQCLDPYPYSTHIPFIITIYSYSIWTISKLLFIALHKIFQVIQISPAVVNLRLVKHILRIASLNSNEKIGHYTVKHYTVNFLLKATHYFSL